MGHERVETFSNNAPTHRLGDFELKREIGRGGMGVVYEAMQLSLQRRVALKLLPFAAVLDPRQISRFKHEAQSAAQIDDPNIVPVFAVGEERGVHYYAMQFIDGRSLSELLDELRYKANGNYLPDCTPSDITIDAGDNPTQMEAVSTVPTTVSPKATPGHIRCVVHMVVQAAKALHTAHEHGVVHRDVKPSNLLIDHSGKVWVTDFGLARCRNGASLTDTGRAIGTRQYMSPEQAAGKSALIDQRTDIYSLGVTLYELVTMHHPLSGKNEVELAEHFKHPRWPSMRSVNGEIPKELDTIVAKATAALREDRYATAEEFADDLTRLMDGKPILACPPSAAVRLGKWAKRHRRVVGTAVALWLLTIVGLASGVALIANERNHVSAALEQSVASERLAKQNLREARNVLDHFGSRVAVRLGQMQGAEGLRRELLHDALAYYESFATNARQDPTMRADLASAYLRMGEVHEQLGARDKARQAYERAISILQNMTGPELGQSEHFDQMIVGQNNFALVMAELGDYDQAQQTLEDALATQMERMPTQRTDATAQRALATTIGNLGLVLSARGDRPAAIERYTDAIRIQSELRNAHPRDEGILSDLAASYNNVCSLAEKAAAPEVIDSYKRAIEIQTQLVAEHPSDSRYQRDLALTYSNLGVAFAQNGTFQDAQSCYVDAIALQQHLVDAAPLVTDFHRDLSISYNNLGMLQREARRLSQARESFQHALELQQTMLARTPNDTNLQSSVGGVYNNLGMVLHQQGAFQEAFSAFARAIACQRKAHLGAASVSRFRELLSKHYYNLASVQRDAGMFADALETALKRKRLWSDEPQRLVSVARELAALCDVIGHASAKKNDVYARCGAAAIAALQEAKQAGAPELPDVTKVPFASLARIPGYNSFVRLRSRE